MNEIIAEAIRIEFDEKEDKLLLVFEVTNQKYKQIIKKTWVNDIEFLLVNKNLTIEGK